MKKPTAEEVANRLEVVWADPNPDQTVDPLEALAKFLVSAYFREREKDRREAEAALAEADPQSDTSLD